LVGPPFERTYGERRGTKPEVSYVNATDEADLIGESACFELFALTLSETGRDVREVSANLDDGTEARVLDFITDQIMG
jgi:hypothetical protein